MPGLNTADVAYKATDRHAIATQTAATATATLTAPGAGKRYLITGYEVSAGAATSATGTFNIKNGSTDIVTLQIPTGVAFAPIVVTLKRPFVVDVNTACSAVCTTLGTGVACTVAIHAVIVAAQ